MATKIRWSWVPGSGVAPDSYKLYRGTASGAETLYVSNITSTFYDDAAVTIGTTYWGYVTEVRGGLESAASNEVSIIAITQPAPDAPLAPVFVVITSNLLGVAPQSLPNNAYSLDLQYTTDPTFSLGVTRLTNVSLTSIIFLTGLPPLTIYYVRFIAMGASALTTSTTIGSSGDLGPDTGPDIGPDIITSAVAGTSGTSTQLMTTGPSGFQSTKGITMAVENASVLNGQQLFVETIPGTSGPATVRLLMTQMSPDEVPDKKAHSQEGVKFAVEVAEGKEMSTIKYDGSLAYLDFAYIAATCLIKPVISTPANNSTWNVAGASGTLGFTYKGQTVVPATYATLPLMQAALGALTTVGLNNVQITGTLAAPIIKFVGALSTDTSALTVAGTPAPTITAGATAVLTRRFTYLIDPLYPDVVQTYTLEKGILGQTGMAEIISYVFGVSMQFVMSKAEQKISGEMMGQIDTDPSTMTTALATGNVTPVPVTGKQVSVFLGDTANNVTRLKRVHQFEFSTGDRQKPVFTLDDSNTSFIATVEGQVVASTKLTMMHDAASQAVLASMRANALKWLIFEAIGPTIETGFNYRMKITQPVKVMNTQKQDTDGTRSAVYEMQPLYNPTLSGVNGGAILVELDVPISALG